MHKVTKARRQESKQTRPALIQTRPAVILQVVCHSASTVLVLEILLANRRELHPERSEKTRAQPLDQSAEDLLPEAPHAWFGVQGLGFRVWGSGFGVQGSGFRCAARSAA